MNPRSISEILQITRTNDYFKKLKQLRLPSDKYFLFGSAPLFIVGIIDEINDLDIIALDDAWELAKLLGSREISDLGGKQIRVFGDPKIEIFPDIRPGDWDLKKVLSRSLLFNGINFANITSVFRWKTLYNREKDRDHLKFINEYLLNHEDHFKMLVEHTKREISEIIRQYQLPPGLRN